MAGDQLRAYLQSLTSSEPVVLLDIHPTSTTEYAIHGSCWGWAGYKGNASSFNLTITAEETFDANLLEGAFLTLIASLLNQFKLCTVLEEVPEPHIKSFDPDKKVKWSFKGASEEPSEILTSDELIQTSLSSALSIVASRAALLAGEGASLAAIKAWRDQRRELADRYLRTAISFYSNVYPEISVSDEALFAVLMRPEYGRVKPHVQVALENIRNLRTFDFTSPDMELTPEQLMARLYEFAEERVDPQHREAFRAKVTEILDYTPRVGIMGKTGVGKSSLGNALFGDKALEVSHVEACTRYPQEVVKDIGNKKQLILVDLPGVGETIERDKEYAAVYSSLLPSLDAVIWVLKADDRSYTIEQQFHKDIVQTHVTKGLPIIFALNQVDKIEPFREWDVKAAQPGLNQQTNIQIKVHAVARALGVKEVQVVPISALENYQLSELVNRVIVSLPGKKRLRVAMSVRSVYRSPETDESVRSGVFDALASVFKSVVEVGRSVAAAIVSLIKKPWNW